MPIPQRLDGRGCLVVHVVGVDVAPLGQGSELGPHVHDDQPGVRLGINPLLNDGQTPVRHPGALHRDMEVSRGLLPEACQYLPGAVLHPTQPIFQGQIQHLPLLALDRSQGLATGSNGDGQVERQERLAQLGLASQDG